jgi:hypothetical protein
MVVGGVDSDGVGSDVVMVTVVWLTNKCLSRISISLTCAGKPSKTVRWNLALIVLGWDPFWMATHSSMILLGLMLKLNAKVATSRSPTFATAVSPNRHSINSATYSGIQVRRQV